MKSQAKQALRAAFTYQTLATLLRLHINENRSWGRLTPARPLPQFQMQIHFVKLQRRDERANDETPSELILLTSSLSLLQPKFSNDSSQITAEKKVRGEAGRTIELIMLMKKLLVGPSCQVI